MNEDQQKKLIELLTEARRLGNQTVKDAGEVARWHKATDALLTDLGVNQPEEHWDAPQRVEARKLIQQMLRRELRRVSAFNKCSAES